MEAPSTRAVPPAAAPLQGERLDSWKEIAAFMHRDVRTVQRWEKHAGLPVHRHAESRLRTAYAYKSELEAWWTTQREALVEAPEQVPRDASHCDTPSAPPPRRWATTGLVAAAVILPLLLGGIAAKALRGRTPALASAAPVPPIVVLLAPLDDRTGAPELAAAIEETVARAFATTREVEPLGIAGVRQTLRLMRREASTRLTPPLAREVALRHGRTDYVISGRLHRVGAYYYADLEAIDPADGAVRHTLEWRGTTPARLHAGASDAARRLGAAVSARPPARGPARALEPVTTTSIEAARLYTAAVQAGWRREWGASELLARRAIALDAGFASAHAWTGWAMRHQGRPVAECLPYLSTAAAAAAELTDREAYFIAAVTQALAGNLQGATAAVEALRRLHPGDRLALDLLTSLSWRAGRIGRAVDLSIERADRVRDDFDVAVRAAHAAMLGGDHRARLAELTQRARALGSPEILSDRPAWSAWLETMPVFQGWAAGDPRAAADALAQVDASLPSRIGRERDAIAAAVGFAHLALGRTDAADRAFRYGSAPDRPLNLAMLALIRNDEAAARRWLAQVGAHSARRPALFARAGLTADALRGLKAMPPSDHAEGIAAVTRGLIAARRRDPAAAAELRTGLQLLRSTGQPELFFAIEALADMAEAAGDTDRVARLLRDAAAERTHTYTPAGWTAGLWRRITGELVRSVRARGHEAEVRELARVLPGTP